jgi:alanine racemase
LTDNLLWAEVDLSAIAHNTRELRRITHPEARLMVGVKADGYGHGAVEVSKVALLNGADALGVARLEEGIALRQAGIQAPILIFGYTLPKSVDALIQHDLTQTVYDTAIAKQLSAAISGPNKRLKVHIKVDTGMGRLGLLSPDHSRKRLDHQDTFDTLSDIKTIADLPGLELEGIFTHFASSDALNKSYAEFQFKRFSALLDEIKKEGISISLRHAANSGAIIDMPHTHLDMVRAGIAFYGLYPSLEVSQDRIQLRPAMAFKTRVIHVKTVPAGFAVSYNSTWQSSTETTIATVPVGYADGFSRSFSNRGQMLLHGRRAPIVGRVCMDLTLLDVGHIPHVKVGDEVVIFGRQENRVLSADELAAGIDTINYEIVSTITARVPRVYLRH